MKKRYWILIAVAALAIALGVYLLLNRETYRVAQPEDLIGSWVQLKMRAPDERLSLKGRLRVQLDFAQSRTPEHFLTIRHFGANGVYVYQVFFRSDNDDKWSDEVGMLVLVGVSVWGTLFRYRAVTSEQYLFPGTHRCEFARSFSFLLLVVLITDASCSAWSVIWASKAL
jgi:hypothetical protein